MKQRTTDVDREGLDLWFSNRKTPQLPDVSRPSVLQNLDQLEVSQGNAFRKLGKSKERIGGEFKLVHHKVIQDVQTPFFHANTDPVDRAPTNTEINTRGRAIGRFSASQAELGPPDPVTGLRTFNYGYGSPAPHDTPKGDLEEFGTTAISIVEPTNPLAGLSVLLGELRMSGLPTVPGIQALRGKTDLARSAGSEYLNKEFGWDPLIGDVRKLVHVINNQQKLINEYERASGRKVRREFRLPPERTLERFTTGQDYSKLYPASDMSTRFFVAPPRWSQSETVEKSLWFVGAFTYYLPPLKIGGSNVERNRRLANKLFGAGLTPEVIWDLSPWTWAIDWVSNAGSVIHNIGAFADNGLVMHYGYVMEKIVRRVETHIWDIRMRSSESLMQTPTSLNPKLMSCRSVIETTQKRRIVATPYGFGLNWDGFSSFQTSILAALGLSKRR